jgi:hypothetical protein
MKKTVDSLYDATCQASLRVWAGHDDVGVIRDRPFHPTKLPLTTVNFLGPQEPISDILSRIRWIVGDDPLGDAIDPECLH